MNGKTRWFRHAKRFEFIVCKTNLNKMKLAAHEEPLTMDDVRTELFQGDDAAEPDFLVSIGSEIHLGVGGLPPWILRNT